MKRSTLATVSLTIPQQTTIETTLYFLIEAWAQALLIKAYWYILWVNNDIPYDKEKAKALEALFFEDLFPILNTEKIAYKVGFGGLNVKRIFPNVSRNVVNLNLGKDCVDAEELPLGKTVNDFIKECLLKQLDPSLFDMERFRDVGIFYGASEKEAAAIAQSVKRIIENKEIFPKHQDIENKEPTSQVPLDLLYQQWQAGKVGAGHQLAQYYLEKKKLDIAVYWEILAFTFGNLEAFEWLESQWEDEKISSVYLKEKGYLGSGPKAIYHLKNQLKNRSEEAKEKNELKNVYLMLALQYLKINYFSTAIEIFNKAALLDDSISLNFLKEIAKNNPKAACALVNFYQVKENKAQASFFCQHAINLYINQLKNASVFSIIDLLLKIAGIYEQLAKFEGKAHCPMAIEYYQKAAEKASIQGDFSKSGEIYWQLFENSNNPKYRELAIKMWLQCFRPASNAKERAALHRLACYYKEKYEKEPTREHESNMLFSYVYALHYEDKTDGIYPEIENEVKQWICSNIELHFKFEIIYLNELRKNFFFNPFPSHELPAFLFLMEHKAVLQFIKTFFSYQEFVDFYNKVNPHVDANFLGKYLKEDTVQAALKEKHLTWDDLYQYFLQEDTIKIEEESPIESEQSKNKRKQEQIDESLATRMLDEFERIKKFLKEHPEHFQNSDGTLNKEFAYNDLFIAHFNKVNANIEALNKACEELKGNKNTAKVHQAFSDTLPFAYDEKKNPHEIKAIFLSKVRSHPHHFFAFFRKRWVINKRGGIKCPPRPNRFI